MSLRNLLLLLVSPSLISERDKEYKYFSALISKHHPPLPFLQLLIFAHLYGSLWSSVLTELAHFPMLKMTESRLLFQYLSLSVCLCLACVSVSPFFPPPSLSRVHVHVHSHACVYSCICKNRHSIAKVRKNFRCSVLPPALYEVESLRCQAG